MLGIQYMPTGGVILPAVIPPTTTSFLMPKNMLCQHTAQFSQVDASFFKHFSLTATQCSCSIDWGVSSFSMHKTLLYQMARKFSAKPPTPGFEDLLL